MTIESTSQTPAADQPASACCSTSEQAVCCEPAARAECCGAPAPAGGSGCGCR